MAPVYKATYSNVPVWMTTVNNVGVMRRQVDGWVNATHILKVAELDKPRRTRILERDVQTGEHEKVQGGYGKYQGTWIPAERAIALAEQFGIEPLIHDLVTYTPGVDGNDDELPPAPKVTAAARKTNTETSLNVHHRSKRARKINSAPSEPSTPSIATNIRTDGSVAGSRKAAANSASSTSGASGAAGHNAVNGGSESTPGKRWSRSPVHRTPQKQSGRASRAKRETLSPESSNVASSESDFLSDDDANMTWDTTKTNSMTPAGHYTAPGGFHPHMTATTDAGQAYMSEFSSKLLDFFMAPNKSEIPDMLLHPRPGPHINQAIDDEGNTAFHWTCAMGQIEVMEALMAAGANIKAVNYAGHTPLVRATMFTNNYDMRSFPKVLEFLKTTMFYRDAQGSSLLHHIAAASASRSRASSTRYYMEILLAKMSENPYAAGIGVDMALAHFVNQVDINGETALHIAARNYSRKLVKVLLSYNAASDIPNKIGRTAQEYIFEYEAQRAYQSQSLAPSSSPPRPYGGRYWPMSAGQGQAGLVSQLPRSPHNPAGHHLNDRQAHNSGFLTHNNHTPRVFASEIAQRAVQEYPAIFTELLGELATTYDSELRDKDTDIEQVRQLLEQVKRKILEVQRQIPEMQQRLGNEQVVNMDVQRLRDLSHQRAIELQKTFERSQARDLALCAQKQELDVQNDLQEELAKGVFDEAEQHRLAAELNKMQVNRRHLVDDIVGLYANAGSRQKISEYRKLLSLCCEVPENDIDGLLDGISQALEDRAS